MSRQQDDAYFNGYQNALGDLANALASDGLTGLLTWAVDNSTRSPAAAEAFRAELAAHEATSTGRHAAVPA